ncbi:MAG: radical SAM family heme chaperone HemW [Deltaproteobacteria bacterium]|nr:radical SAM family heme chaperone HemW [Deltaproteobacteria bacterium]
MRILGEEKKTEGIGVYVHIPFCRSKCPYCDFASVTTPAAEEEYTDCLLKELSAFLRDGAARSRALESIYIGGGTPSLFSPASIARIIKAIKAAFSPCASCEVTIEANPESIDKAFLSGCIDAGMNRLSIGFQSLDDNELKTLGRAHTAKQAVAAFASARKAGFGNIGVDLISGVPGQTVGSLCASLSKVMELRPEHLSLYGLTYEEGTPMTKERAAGRFNGLLPSEEEEEEMYLRPASMLAQGGFLHYEVSNWALPGFESRHNSRYWLGKDYIGLGASAHSFISSPRWGRRWWNEPSAGKYMERIRKSGEARSGFEELGRQEAMTESLFLGLRMIKGGLKGAPFRERFGLLPKEAFKGCAEMEGRGLIRSSGDDLFLTERGVLLSNGLFLEMV